MVVSHIVSHFRSHEFLYSPYYKENTFFSSFLLGPGAWPAPREAAMGSSPCGQEGSEWEWAVRGTPPLLRGCCKLSPWSQPALLAWLGVTGLRSRGECLPGGLVSPAPLLEGQTCSSAS